MRTSTWTLALLVGLIAGLPVTKAESLEGRVWVVDETGFDCPDADFQDIQPAVNAASPGDTILVCPGLYSPVVVDKDDLVVVSLEAYEHRGMHTIVHGNGLRGNAFTIAADGVMVKGLWVSSAAGADEEAGNGFVVTGNGAKISWCTSTLNERDGIRIVRGRDHRIEQCRLSYNGQPIFIAGEVFGATVEDNQLVEYDPPATIGTGMCDQAPTKAVPDDAGG